MFSQASCVAKPSCFRLTVPSLSTYDRSPDSSDDHDLMFYHSTTLEFKLTDISGVGMKDRPANHKQGRFVPLRMFARLLRNQAVEHLTVHGLWVGTSEPCAVSVPSLKSLDLCWSERMYGRLTMLDAPPLCELAIDDVLLRYLTPASTSDLSSPTLRMAGTLCLPEPELPGIEKIGEHQGAMKLGVGPDCNQGVLKLLCEDFFWPGLQEVEMDLSELIAPFVISQLIIIIAARHAGARGASRERYLEILRTCVSRLSNGSYNMTTGDYGSAWTREAQAILAEAAAVELDADTPPLCSQVRWKLVETDGFLDGLLDWLKDQPFVKVQHYRGPLHELYKH